jgi:hypothetical protein
MSAGWVVRKVKPGEVIRVKTAGGTESFTFKQVAAGGIGLLLTSDKRGRLMVPFSGQVALGNGLLISGAKKGTQPQLSIRAAGAEIIFQKGPSA